MTARNRWEALRFVVPLLVAMIARTAAAEEGSVAAAIDRGVRFLLNTQNADGSWGGVKNATYTSAFGNPATYFCWQVGTTGLATQAVMELGRGAEAETAADKGLQFIVDHRRLVRPADWDVDNVWGLIYGLTALSHALALPRWKDQPQIREAATQMVGALRKYQSPRGGWGYYAFNSAARPEWATSFTTSAGVIALLDAKGVGILPEDKSLTAAVKAVELSRLPNGAYSYSVDALPRHLRMEDIDQVKGSLSRIQVGNYALLRAERGIKEDQLAQGLELFFRHHKFLDAARNKPIPHEAYYFNAAYFYFFGHYYAAKVIGCLPPEKRPGYAQRLQAEILKCQQEDGSMWDFWIANDTHAFGTAFGILALAETMSEPQQ